MSNEYDYEEDFESENETNAPKELRSLVRKQTAELKELKAQLESYQANEKKQTIVSILKTKGINEEVAEFIPSDLQDEESINTWLGEKGKLFGYDPNATNDTASTANTQTTIQKPANNIADLQSMSVPNDVIDDLNNRLANATTQAEIKEIMATAHRAIIN